ncbi:MAG: dioxygenase [Thermoguttaceae bacterium]
MAAYTVRKSSHEGIGYSVVDLNDVCHVFAAATPRHGGSLRQQAADALQTIAAVTDQQHASGSIVHQAVFVADSSQVDECRRLIREFYGDQLPATSYVVQAPCDGKLLAIEAMGVGQGRGEVEIERLGEQLVIARHNGIAWAHCAQVVPASNGSVYTAAQEVFRRARLLLGEANVGFERVIRTWLYLGGIVDVEAGVERYRELNRARADFFRDISFLNNRSPSGRQGSWYPASTGIGTQGRGLMFSAIALSTDRPDILAVPLENPRQTAAYDYARRYSPESPKFSRAMALSCGNYATIFISGTASIVASETRHQGDPVAQTHETLDNIAALIGEENLSRHGLPGLGASLDGLGLVRVYIKRPSDYAAVRAACELRLGEVPTIYATADVCRNDLLVEIEGIAFARRDATAPIAARGGLNKMAISVRAC